MLHPAHSLSKLNWSQSNVVSIVVCFSGFEDAEGMHGAFIVRRPKGSDPNGQTYDFDLSEHTAVIWHWTINSAKETFNLGRFQNSRVLGNQLLINGKGTGAELIIEGVPYYAPREVFTVTQVKEQYPCADIQLICEN